MRDSSAFLYFEHLCSCVCTKIKEAGVNTGRFDFIISKSHSGGTVSDRGISIALEYSSNVDRPSASPPHNERGRQPFRASYWTRRSESCSPNRVNRALAMQKVLVTALHSSKVSFHAAYKQESEELIRDHVINRRQPCAAA